MMPKYVCKKCNHEFAGWGAHYSRKAGNRLICPDCNGNLIEKKEGASGGIISKLLSGAGEPDAAHGVKH
ncbi:MAG: hypothetical protein HY893_00335 [Deltaproteobacteria bacterium]|nr:hypothetical protein [Deltaproteobacteria bacterium]